MPEEPRIAPLPKDELQEGLPPYNIFLTLAKHPKLFQPWLAFGGALLFDGELPARIREVAILRTAYNTGCDYEHGHHVKIGLKTGLTEEEITALGGPLGAYDWTEDDWLVVAAADELHSTGNLSNDTWKGLARRFDERGLIELTMLIGHYTMLAFTLNALRVQPDA